MASETGGRTGERRVLLIGTSALPSRDAAGAPELEGVHWQSASIAKATGVARSCTGSQDTVAVIVLDTDPTAGMVALSAFQRHAPGVPVVVVATDPSVEQVRRIRHAGAFYLALDPVTPEELRAALVDAFACVARGQTKASLCRSRPKILIVDRDVDSCAVLTTILRAGGYDVASAHSGRACAASVASEPPDLLILDSTLEDEAGDDVDRSGAIPVLTLTKPIDAELFLENVRLLLGPPPENDAVGAR